MTAARADIAVLDLRPSIAEIADALDAAFARVMRSGRFLLGEELERFELAYARYCGAAHCVGVGSGLDALSLSLRALGIGPGDEVIVPSHTFIATWLAVTAVGATIVPVEPDEASFNISERAVAAAITSRTAAVIPVHLYGLPSDIAPLELLCQSRDVALIADAAQAHGCTYQSRPIGSFATANAWSFYPGKNLGAFGDGGAITTNDAELAARLRRLRNYGSEEKYVHIELGTNSRLDELQSAFLMEKLSMLPVWNERRSRIADQYLESFQDLPLVLPQRFGNRSHVWHQFVVRSDRRDELATHLRAHSIGSLIHYPIPPHRQRVYEHLRIGSLPIADGLAGSVLSLPMGPHLSEGDVAKIVGAVRRFFCDGPP